MLLQLLIVGAVALVVFGYARVTRRAREAWVDKLDLPGIWRTEEEAFRLVLSGDRAAGEFVKYEGARERRGRWRLKGHLLCLEPAEGGTVETLDLTWFKPGNIGVTDERGQRRLLYKDAGNVIPLRRSRDDPE